MSTSVLITCVLIVAARITDVSLDTVRTVAIVQGRRLFAATLGFVEAIIYISVVAKVLMNMDQPVYALAYGLGFALGTYLGIAIEQRLAFGHQVASLFTRKGAELSRALLEQGYRLVAVNGHVRDGAVTILYVEVPRKRVRRLLRDAAAVDAACSCVVNDVRVARFVPLPAASPGL